MILSKDIFTWTVSNLFIVPILEIPRSRLNEVGFVNSYLINGESDEESDHHIYLLFKPSDLEEFNFFLFEERQRGAKIINEEDFPKGYVLITYELPEGFSEDFKKIWLGQYSKLSAKYKKMIPSVARYQKSNGITVADKTIQHKIFDKDSGLRSDWEKEFNVIMDSDQELWTKPTKESETFKISKYESSARNTA